MTLKGRVKFLLPQSQGHRKKPSAVTSREPQKPPQLGGDLLLRVKLKFSSKFTKPPLSLFIQWSYLSTTFTVTYTSKYTDMEGDKHTDRQENTATNFQSLTLTRRRALAYLGPSEKKKQLPALLHQSCKEAENLPAFSQSKCQYPDTTHAGETDGCQKMKTPMRNLGSQLYQTCRVAELKIH